MTYLNKRVNHPLESQTEGRTLMKGQKCITKRLIFANRWFSIDVILQELPPVCGHVVANVHDFST